MFQKPLVAYDFVPSSAALRASINRLGEQNPNAKVHFLNVVKTVPFWLDGMGPVDLDRYWQGLQAQADYKMQKELSDLIKHFPSWSFSSALGSPSEILDEQSKQGSYDSLILWSDGHSFAGRIFLGSTSSHVIRHSKIPVLVLGEERPWLKQLDRVLVAVDANDKNLKILQCADEIAIQTKAPLEIISHLELPLTGVLDSGFDGRFEIFEELRKGHKSKVNALVKEAQIVSQHRILESEGDATKDAILRTLGKNPRQCVVLGTSGHSAVERFFLGSTATAVLNQAPCPVCVIPRSQKT